MGGTCECGYEPSDSIKCGEFLDWLRTGQLVKKDCCIELVQNQKTECKGGIMLPCLWTGTVQELLKKEKQNEMEEVGKDEVAT